MPDARGQSMWSRVWALPTKTWARVLAVALFALGVLMTLGFLFTTVGTPLTLALALPAVAAFAFVDLLPSTFPRKIGRGFSRAVLAGYYVGSLYVMVAFLSQLGWAFPQWVWIAVIIASFEVGSTQVWRSGGFMLPASVPVGIVCLTCAASWPAAHERLLCDDVLAVRAQAGVQVIVPSSVAAASCKAGQFVPVWRFPRRVWEAPGGKRLIFTTQRGTREGQPTDDPLTGAVCSTTVGGTPRCIGEGRAQGIVEAPKLDRVFIAAWGRFDDDTLGRVHSVPRSGNLKQAKTLALGLSTGELFYDPAQDLVGLATDEGEELVRVQASTLELLDRAPTPVIPGDTRFDPTTGEGVYCWGAGPLLSVDGASYLAVGFKAKPYALRPLGAGALSWLSLSWGCDWDPAARRVWTTSANLGLLSTIDYDSGQVLESTYVGLGIRTVTHDPARGRLYLGVFIPGTVLDYDLASKKVVREWFVGRFVRGVTLTRDGKRLLATSNQGVVEVSLDGDGR